MDVEIGQELHWPEVLASMTYFFSDEMYAMAADDEKAVLFSLEGNNPVTLRVMKIFTEEKK